MDDEKESQSQKNQSAGTFFEVAFKEIDALYDLHGHRRVVGSPTKPMIVIDRQTLLGRASGPHFIGEDGKPVEQHKLTELPGMYQDVRVDGWDLQPRTFSRQAAHDVDGKFVYMFAARSKDGAGMKLHAELLCVCGRFFYVPLDGNEKKDNRQAAGDSHATLLLQMVGLDAADQQYFFILTPHQLPWQAIKDMEASPAKLVSRAARVRDYFVTDTFVDGDPRTAQPRMPGASGSVDGAREIGFLVYLVDPFKEAKRRAKRYIPAVEAWQRHQMQMGKDPEYALAKRIERFVSENEELTAIVEDKLRPYLLDREEELNRLNLIAHDRLGDLLRWIGEWQVSSELRDTAYFDGKSRVYLTQRQSVGKERVNLFSDLVHAYMGAPEDTYRAVGQMVHDVLARVGDLPSGRAFLQLLCDHYRLRDLAREPGQAPLERREADAGAEYFFESVRKGEAFASEVTALLFEHFAGPWVKAHAHAAQGKLIEFMGARGIEVRRVTHGHRAERAVFDRRLEQVQLRAKRGTVRALEHVALGVEIFNLRWSIMKLTEKPDRWNALGLTGSLFDAYAATAKLVPKLEKPFGITWATPALGFVSGAIDAVLGVHEMLTSSNLGEEVGHGLQSLGGMFCAYGSLAGGAGTILGIGLEALGALLVAVTPHPEAPPAHFLRHCRWGTLRKRDSYEELGEGKQDLGADFGFRGKLIELKTSIVDQNRALDFLIWQFKPAFQTTTAPPIPQLGPVPITIDKLLRMRIAQTAPVGPEAKWRISLAIRNERETIRAIETPTNESDNLALSANDSIVVAAFAKGEAAYVPVIGSILHVRGRIILDVYGDGQKIVEHDFNVSVLFEV